MIHVSSITSPPCYAPDELYTVAGRMKGKREEKEAPADDVIINESLRDQCKKRKEKEEYELSR